MKKPLFVVQKSGINQAIYSNCNEALKHVLSSDDLILKDKTPLERHDHFYNSWLGAMDKPDIKIYTLWRVYDHHNTFLYRDWKIIKTYVISKFLDYHEYDLESKYKQFFNDLLK